MQRQKREKRLLEFVENLRKLQAGDTKCEQARQRLYAAIKNERANQLKYGLATSNIWNKIIKSKITKLAAAAVIVLLISLFSINILTKRSYTEIDTLPSYILSNNNLKETIPCNILPVLPNQF
ncbi:MAG: hypothetical protein ACYSSI_02320 [Planctomycetota bacterium]|jgi:hypothetical protein